MNGATRALVVGVAILAVAPSSEAQETEGTHRVRAGDTLWDLAARYLADPFRWPELYDLNTQIIEDPHWIFPGESLRLPGPGAGDAERVAGRPRAPAAVPSRAERAARPVTPEKPGTASRSFGPTGQFPEASVFRSDPSAPSYGDLSIAATEPRRVVSMSDFYGASVLADRRSFAPDGTTARVVAEPHPSLRLRLPRAARLNDQVVLHLTAGDAAVGNHYRAVEWGRSLGAAGDVLHTVGAVRVTRTYATGDSARAVVVQIFGDYRVGDMLVAAEAFTVEPGVESEAEDFGPVGAVLGFTQDQTLLGTGETLFLDLGADDGVRVGDLFAVFSSSATGETALFDDRLSLVRVVHTSATTSTGRVTEVRDPGMRPGSPVRRVERMPL
jgi:hypothetical protein